MKRIVMENHRDEIKEELTLKDRVSLFHEIWNTRYDWIEKRISNEEIVEFVSAYGDVSFAVDLATDYVLRKY